MRSSLSPAASAAALETLMVWQLLQVRHLDERTPLILIGKMYDDLVEWAREYMLRPEFPLANPEDMKIPVCVNTADEAITVIRKHHASWRKEQRRGKGRARVTAPRTESKKTVRDTKK